MNRRRMEAIMQIIPLSTGAQIQLKKQHPCGNDLFRILRVGSDVRIKCERCGRDMTLDRVKLEKSIRKILEVPDEKAISKE